MKYHAETGSKKVVLNDVDIPVPRGINYVTVNMNDVVQGWIDKPYLYDGYWRCDSCQPVRLGWIEFSFGDDRPWNALEVHE